MERETDPKDVTDDWDIKLNLPREDIEEWERPREDIREFSGATASGTTAASQEEHHRLQLPNGMGATANRGSSGTDQNGFSERILPMFQQHRQSTGAATSTWVDTDISGVSRMPGGQLPGNGTQLDSDFYADARGKG